MEGTRGTQSEGTMSWHPYCLSAQKVEMNRITVIQQVVFECQLRSTCIDRRTKYKKFWKVVGPTNDTFPVI